MELLTGLALAVGLAALGAVALLWRRVTTLGGQQMADEQATGSDIDNLKAAVAAIDAETTRLGQVVADEGTTIAGVADRVQKLIDQLKTEGGSVSREDIVAATTQLETEVAALKQSADNMAGLNSQLAAIAANPDDPTPSAPPV